MDLWSNLVNAFTHDYYTGITIQGVRKVWERLYISSGKVLFKKVKVISEVIINEEFNGDLQFDLELDLQGHFKINLIF